jgi:hypothetical protein
VLLLPGAVLSQLGVELKTENNSVLGSFPGTVFCLRNERCAAGFALTLPGRGKYRLAAVSADYRAFFACFAAFLSLGVFDGVFLVCFLESCAFDMLFLG